MPYNLASARACLICGSPITVKSHLIPRALMLDMRGEEKTIVSGSSHRDGKVFKQNGDWDDGILCKEHEDTIGAGDDYGIDFVRSAVKRSTPIYEDARAVHNPEPLLLMHFIYACVWRTVVSQYGREVGLTLGPYEAVIRAGLIGRGPYNLPAIVGVNRVQIQGEVGKFSFLPRRGCTLTFNNQRTKPWHFTIGGLEFILFAQKFRYPEQAAQFFANGNARIVMPSTSVLDARGLPAFQRIIGRMMVTPARPRR